MNRASVRDVFSGPLFSGQAGVPLCLIDTSTLIYLEKLVLLERVAAVFSVATIAGVIREFGSTPKDVTVYPAGEGATDLLLVQQAVRCNAVVFSEDKKVLRHAGRCGLEYYNTLMIVLALYGRGEIDRNSCADLLGHLDKFARYGENVRAFGRQVLAELDRNPSWLAPSDNRV